MLGLRIVEASGNYCILWIIFIYIYICKSLHPVSTPPVSLSLFFSGRISWTISQRSHVAEQLFSVERWLCSVNVSIWHAACGIVARALRLKLEGIE